MDMKTIQTKWQKKWDEAKIFEANPNDKEKYFVNFPYPYINGLSHIGHLYTLMRVDALARYKRHKGFNVLFPQGWHATGSPIVNAAKRVKNKEVKQIKIMKDMGFSDKELKKFEKPEYWIEYFSPQFEEDYKSMGMSIDWRRNFVTTSINSYYDKFIRWQFRKLKEKGFVIKGKFPVVWDPKEGCAVGDHARVEGEGEAPQEFCLFKFKLPDGRFIITATLRPDTLMGITNVYINPEETYSEIEIIKNNKIDSSNKNKSSKEKWIVGTPMIEKLKMQEFKLKEISKVKGKELVGKEVEYFDSLKVPVLPASFLDSKYGTGIVHSVPSDSADDLIALRNFQEDEKTIKKFGMDVDKIKSIQPIAIFDTPEIGNLAAEYFLKKYNVKSQNDRNKLDKIKKELYTLTFNKSTFNDKYKTIFSKNLKGVLVKDGQELIKNELLEKGLIEKFYELTGKVVSRTLTECVVKIVDNQWFLDYNNPEWKQLAHKCLDNMNLYPEKSRAQFNYVIDWLHEWACTREEGLGTKLPWDEKWLIESLSDSTIYMAYYTIVHILKTLPIEKINDELFDYIFLNKGEKPKVAHIDEMKQNFEYFYPVDFRNSGKDLIQNHLTFFIFNHVAIFPEEKWPKGIGVNGWVTVDGQKMSKSLGNMIPLRDMSDKFTTDASRLTILNGGEEMDDPNWDSEFAKSIVPKLNNLYEFSKENYGKHHRTEWEQIDAWAESELHKIIKSASEAMELTLFRTAIQTIYFDLQRVIKYYLRRTKNNPNEFMIDKLIESQIIMLAPFTPHLCEEIWESLGKKGFISLAEWPLLDESKINESLNTQEKYLSQIFTDVRKVKVLAKLNKISKIRIFVSLPWKYNMFNIVKKEIDSDNRDFKIILGKLMTEDSIKQNSKDVTKILPNLLKKGLPEFLLLEEEFNLLNKFVKVIQDEFSTKIEITKAENSEENKARQASPGKPAILIE